MTASSRGGQRRALRSAIGSVIAALATITFGPLSQPVSAAIVNNVSFRAPVHTSYDHQSGGGAWNDGSTTWVKGELQGTDYKCGDIATFLFQLVTTSEVAGPISVQTMLEYTADSTGQSGVALVPLVEPQHLRVNDGPIPDQAGTGFTGSATSGSDGGFRPVGSGMTTTARVATTPAPVVTAIGDLFTSGAKQRVTFTTENIPASATTIIRSDTRILCKAGSSPTGNLQASLISAQVTSPTTQSVSSGNQTVNFRGVGNLGGLTTPMLEVVKEVYSGDVSCPATPQEQTSVTTTSSPLTVTYCYWVYNWAAATANGVTLSDDMAGQSAPQAIPLTFPVSSGTTSNLGGGGEVATGRLVQTYADPGVFTNVAAASATNGGTALDGSAVVSVLSGPVLTKEVVVGDASTTPSLCDSAVASLDLDTVSPGPVTVSYCYTLANFGATDVLDVALVDDEAVPGNLSPPHDHALVRAHRQHRRVRPRLRPRRPRAGCLCDRCLGHHARVDVGHHVHQHRHGLVSARRRQFASRQPRHGRGHLHDPTAGDHDREGADRWRPHGRRPADHLRASDHEQRRYSDQQHRGQRPERDHHLVRTFSHGPHTEPRGVHDVHRKPCRHPGRRRCR